MNSMTFEPTLEEFKSAVAEFCAAAPDCDRESLENGFKAMTLMYFGTPQDQLTTLLAVSYFEYAQRRYKERDIELLLQEIQA